MKMKRCPLCGQEVPELLYDLHRSVDGMIVSRMKRDFPGWTDRDGVCGPCLERYRGQQFAVGARFTDAALSAHWVPSWRIELARRL